MKAVVQRVLGARVLVDGEVVGEVAGGMLVLLGVMAGDGPREVERLADKLSRWRMFEDGAGRMNLDLAQVGGQALVVSQFTLAADGRKGRRPSFDKAAPPGEAEPLYEAFVAALRGRGHPCATGCFGAKMQVELRNDGPVTFVLEEAPVDTSDG